MATLHNEILVNAPLDKVWTLLTDLERLEQYDPTVKKSSLISREKTGLGAKRKVEMGDGKNWFEEHITEFKPHEALSFQLTDCSFPISRLSHRYSFEANGNQTKVKQVMDYSVKFGLFGKLLDLLMIRKQSDKGIKKFFLGLKSYIESH